MVLERYISIADDGIAGADEETYVGNTVDLGTIKAALRRHRLFWVACAVLGLVCGATFHLAIPAKYVAITTLYLTEPTNIGTYTIADDVNLLETTAVVRQALAYLPSSLKTRAVGSYKAVPLGNTLIMIKADGSTPEAAVRWAGALAKGFFTVRAQTFGRQTRLIESSLQSQAAQLETSIRRLNRAIDVLSTSHATANASNQISDMVSERGTDQSQVTTLQNTIESDVLEEQAISAGSYVLDPPRAALVDTKRIFLEDGLAGLVAGSAIGIGALVVGAILSDRPRRRAEISALLGAPVELSLPGPAEPAWMSGATVRRSVKKPSPQLAAAARRLRDRLAGLARPALAVVSVGDASTNTAACLVAVTALSMARDGKQVALVDMAQRRPLAALFHVRAVGGGAVRTVTFDGQRISLAVAPEDATTLDAEEITKVADAVLVLGEADPAVGLQHLRSWAEASVVILRAGKSSDRLVEATGQMLRDAGMSAFSAILLGAEKGDDSFGMASIAPDVWVANPGAHARSSSTTSLSG